MTDAKKLFEAVIQGDVNIVREILTATPEWIHILSEDHFNGSPLNVACGRNDRTMVDCLIDAGADLELASDWWPGPWTPLQSALCYGHMDLARHLVARGAKVDAHAAAGLGDLDALRKLVAEDPQCVHALGGDGCHPLHFASSVAAAKFLLAHGADIDARDIDHHSTPAQYLVNHHPEVTRFLLSHGANADIFTAVAAGDEDVVQRLIAEDSKVLDARITQEYFPPGPKHPGAMNILTFSIGHNATPLHAAAMKCQLPMIDLLVEAGMSTEIRGAYDDCTPLHLAAWNNHGAAVRRLVGHGADVNVLSGEMHNNSPAGWAIVAGSAEAMAALLEAGAEIMDFFAGDAEGAIAGNFREFGNCNPEDQRRILELIEQYSD